MKKLLFIFIAIVASLYGFAQQYHFVYIQADNQQPFYAKYSGKNYSSSSIGYLILPKLNDGSFSVQIGFPRNMYPEQTFNLSVSGKDLGFALKNFGDKGWGLFNFQTTDIVMNVNAVSASGQVAKAATTTNSSNPFGNMLADAIQDSTLNQQPVANSNSKVKTNIPATTATTTAANNSTTDSTVKNTLPTPQANNAPPQTDSLTKNRSTIDNLSSAAAAVDSTLRIIKSSENTTNGGTDLTFLDNTSKDTIHAFIPSADTAKTNATEKVNKEVKAIATDSSKKTTDNPFFNKSDGNGATTTQPAIVDTATTNIGGISSAVSNSNCQKMLSSYDIDKLKKKITKTDNQEDILAAIKKALRDKCVTTEQVKDFGDLFNSDEYRYNFYDAVYPHVSDYFNYPQLQNTLIDTYYKNRFKALLH